MNHLADIEKLERLTQLKAKTQAACKDGVYREQMGTPSLPIEVSYRVFQLILKFFVNVKKKKRQLIYETANLRNLSFIDIIHFVVVD